ncbi:helix-hairpin-helix domain-containing protein [Amycolatopsis sp. cg13]|uniref:helix-hairpin-helix domain-containing protein n=1 Tax=Amycolatopsis sp. cg13 TaxID=3238807 RepID=UPI0035254EDE
MFEQPARDPGTPVNVRLTWLADQLAAVPHTAGPGDRPARRWLPLGRAGRSARGRLSASADSQLSGGTDLDSQPAAETSSQRHARPTGSHTGLSAFADNPSPSESQLPGGKLVRSWLPEHTEQRWTRRWLPGATGLPGFLGRRGMVFALALLAAAAVIAGGLAIFGRSPAAEIAPPLPTARAQAPHASKTNENLVISVVGHVRSPGLVTVPSGSRVADALRAAGGANPGVDLTALNLARKLTDGEQLAVGVPAAQAAPAGSAAAASKIDLNSATAEQLDSLPGVGEVTARRITDWRTQHGGFSSVEQLRDVDGIGESKFQKLREQVTVG